MKIKLLSKYFLLLLILLSYLSLIYLPVLTGFYAHHDEYMFFINDIGSTALFPFFYLEFSLGRYLAAFIYDLQEAGIHGVADLNSLRFQAIINLSLCGVVLVGLFEKHFKRILPAFLIVIGILTLPPFQVLVSWGINSCKSYSLSLACIAFLSVKDLTLRKHSGSLRAGAAFLIPITALLFALSINQPGAMFYWLLVGIAIYFPESEEGPNRQRSPLKMFAVGAGAMILYFIIVQLLKGTFGGLTNLTYDPYSLTGDFTQKIIWFLNEPVYNSFNLWSIYPSIKFALFIIIFLIGAGLIQMIGSGGRFRTLIGQYALFLLLIFLSYAPSLLSAGYPGFYRTCIALTPLVLCACLMALLAYLSILPVHCRRLLLIFSLMIVAAYGSFKAYTNVLIYRVEPSHKELSYVLAEVKRGDLTRYNRVHFIGIDPQSYQHLRRYDEFGVPTTQFQQNLPLILKCALREIGLEKMFYNFYPRITLSYSEPEKKLPKTLIIDINKAGVFGD